MRQMRQGATPPSPVSAVEPGLRIWGPSLLDQSLDRQRVGKATPGKFCKRWLQARRARSDAPYHHGIAMRHFDLMANFGFRDKRLFIGRVPQIVRAGGAKRDFRSGLTTKHAKPHGNRSGAGTGSGERNHTAHAWRRGWPFRQASGPTRRAGRPFHPFPFRIAG